MEVVWLPGDVRLEVHLTSADTGGAFCLLVDHPPAGWSLPAHRHAREAETIHVVEGRFEQVVDGETHVLGPGDTIHVPQGASHAGANIGEGTGRRVILFSPGGLERFFLEVGAPTPDAVPGVAEVLAAAGRHGWRFG